MADVGATGAEIRATRIEKAKTLQMQGMTPYAYRWERTHTAAVLQEKIYPLGGGRSGGRSRECGWPHYGAARLLASWPFFTLQDDSGTIQLYLDKQTITQGMGEAAFADLKHLTDVGDILGAVGTLKRTEKGELSVVVESYRILTKSLLPLPDKWHGLTDVEKKRYRQRYVDLIVNPHVRDTFRKRALITAAIRRYLNEQGFIEIERRCYRQKLAVQKRVPSSRITTHWRCSFICALPRSYI